jgi:hypothetical protein
VLFAFARGWPNPRLEAAQLRALRRRALEREWVVVGGQAGAMLEADEFELLRARTGRRSRDQILTMNWDADPEMYLETLSSDPFPENDVTE